MPSGIHIHIQIDIGIHMTYICLFRYIAFYQKVAVITKSLLKLV